MKPLPLALACALVAFAAGGAGAAELASPEAPHTEAAPKAEVDVGDEIYRRLAAATDAEETDGLVRLLFASYASTGSATGDLLLERAHKAMAVRDFPAAGRILDAAIAFMPDRAEGWNARATLRYLDDDFDGSMADIAQTLKREPRHLGALMGMASILESRDKKAEALAVCQRALSIAPHWTSAQDRVDRLKAAIAGEAL